MKNTLILCTLAFIASTVMARANTIAFTPPELNFISDEPTGNDGMFFTPTTTISVTSLGYVNPGSAEGNEVGLYDLATNTWLATATINSSSSQTGSFLYESIAPVTLTAGDEYAVVGHYVAGQGDQGYTADGGVGAAFDIIFNGYAYNLDSTLSLPTTDYSPGIFGPDFQYTDVTQQPVGTPSGGNTLLMFGGAMIGLMGLRRKTRA